MNYFGTLPNSKEFIKFYKIKPHLLKKHQKDFTDNKIKDKYLLTLTTINQLTLKSSLTI